MPYHNIQQLSDAVDTLVSQSGQSNEREASFIVSQVQPLTDRITKLETLASQLQQAINDLKGTPKP